MGILSTSCELGTDTGNPVWVSECKSNEADTSAAGDPARVSQRLTQEELPPGLECLLWESLPSDELAIHMHNFGGPCGALFQGEIDSAGPAAYRLRLTNTSCEIARCGGCLYDSDFGLEAVSPDLDAATSSLELTREEFSCDAPNAPLASTHWSLPLSSEPDGMRCRFGGGNDSVEFGPCEGEECDEGLSCVETAEDGTRCLRACTTNDDCAPSEAVECNDGYCIPRGFE